VAIRKSCGKRKGSENFEKNHCGMRIPASDLIVEPNTLEAGVADDFVPAETLDSPFIVDQRTRPFDGLEIIDAMSLHRKALTVNTKILKLRAFK
jgi:hypothetical protein